MSTQLKMMGGLPLELYACLLVAQLGVFSAPLGAPNGENIGDLLAKGSETKYSAQSHGAAREIYSPENLSHQYRLRSYETKNIFKENKTKFDITPNTEIQANIPVIHLPENGEDDDSMSKTFLDLIPQTFLSENKQIRPLKIHIIEHDDYIDYEVEFIEVEENSSEIFTSNAEDYIDIIYDDVEETKDAVQNPITEKLDDSDHDSNASFNYLLNNARRRHKSEMDKTKENNEHLQTIEELENHSKINVQRRRISNSRKIDHRNSSKRNRYIPKHRIKVEKQITTNGYTTRPTKLKTLVKPTIPTHFFNINRPSNRNKVDSQLSTKRPATSEIFTTPEKPTISTTFININTSKIETTTQSPYFATNSILDDTSLSTPRITFKTPEEDNKVTETSIDPKLEEVEFDQTTQTSVHDVDSKQFKSSYVTTIPTVVSTTKELSDYMTTPLETHSFSSSPLPEIQSQLISIKDLTTQSYSEIVTDETHIPNGATTTNSLLQNKTDVSHTVADVSPIIHGIGLTTNTPKFTGVFDVKKKPTLSELSIQHRTESYNQTQLNHDHSTTPSTNAVSPLFSVTTENYSQASDSTLIGNTANNTDTNTTSESGQESIDLTTDTETEISTIISEGIIEGQYHEINPGQYHEVNPGQYHEINPGQYHEVNPGQYKEDLNGNNEKEESNTKHIGVDNLTVDFNHGREQDTKVYNVKANAGDFIIGEVGRIDVNSGQTLEGVRYTAVEGEVDIARISHILESFFGARTS